jgi:hypothetical protein
MTELVCGWLDDTAEAAEGSGFAAPGTAPGAAAQAHADARVG